MLVPSKPRLRRGASEKRLERFRFKQKDLPSQTGSMATDTTPASSSIARLYLPFAMRRYPAPFLLSFRLSFRHGFVPWLFIYRWNGAICPSTLAQMADSPVSILPDRGIYASFLPVIRRTPRNERLPSSSARGKSHALARHRIDFARARR